MIAARDLAKTYRKTRVLKNVSFDVPDNSILAVAGANGAGKTTLLKLLALILKPDSGSVLIGGEDASANPDPYRKRIGYVPQSNAFFPELTVKENLDYWRIAACRLDAASLLGLEGVLGKKASSLSGGMQRRLNLALGLLNDPGILIMDEPLTGVDVKTRQLILGWMAALRGKGMTVVYSTHHADEIERTADRLLMLRDGAVTHEGPAAGEEGRIARLFSEFI